MRTRKSNQAKRYRPSDLDPTLASDDEEIVHIAQTARGESEDGYREEEAGESESDAKDAQLDSVETSESEPEPEEPAAPRRAPKPVPPRPRKKEVVSTQPSTTNAVHTVPDYPLDPSAKWTRAYVGPLKRWTRFHDMVILLYGDRDNYRRIVSRITRVWWDFQVLPPRPVLEKHLQLAAAPWVASTVIEEQQRRLKDRLEQYANDPSYMQNSHYMEPDRASSVFLPKPDANLTLLLGEHENQHAYTTKYRHSTFMSESGSPIEHASDAGPNSGGWLLDIGGIVVAMDWASSLGHDDDQLLALSVIPEADQAYQHDLSKAPTPAVQKEGSVQLWRFPAERDGDGIMRPAQRQPQLVHAICSLWGRVAKIQWCPVPIDAGETTALLGVLCADGKLRVVAVRKHANTLTEVFEEVQDAMISIEIPKEHTVAITCFTWVNSNRIAVGCSDGSIGMWSIFPCQQLQRHPVHSSSIIDIASGYPSQPTYIASLPVGGVLTVTDLNRPTAEMSYNANLLVSLQPSLLAWSEVLRGYLSMWPTNFTANSTVSYSGLTTFPQPRHILTVESQVTCLATSPCHPYLLVGASDGSLWSTNVLRKIMGYREKVNKIRILKHEYRPAKAVTNQDPSRGVVRISHGYLPEVNDHPRANFTGKQASESKKSKKKKKGPKSASHDDIEEDGFDAMDEAGAMTFATGPLIIEDPRTRITAIAWNPNAVFSTWAAVSTGSGLIRVIDLGVDGGGIDLESSDSASDLEDEDMPDVNDRDE
ncbi:WD40-repeat-containing domain protein [Microdochium bolleyi]|uniref:WD40-repeat-containing domain protein n=1 Tax=Microdochium bolleyi TaxID=196109 RepID=A0A136JF01_9PEZI|nr:WD40-repeat-containing domain protein [Microdochium bolleyi]